MTQALVEREETQLAQPVQQSPSRLIEMAISSNADIEKLEKLMEMQERWDAKQAERAFNDAMSRFQAECPVIESHKQGHNYKYAPIGDIIAQVKDLLADHGLSYRFSQSQEGQSITVTCIATHRDGHSVELSMTGNPDNSGSKNGVQAVGSTVTYLRRYTFTGIFGIVTADTDSDARVQASQKIEMATVTQAGDIINLCTDLDIDESQFMGYLSSRLNFAQQITSYMQLTKEQADFAISALKKKMGAK
ncbi:ERF family protein [Oceanospirillum phage vB_OliS_GJ44]|nr:ERF family protein [Oceanospirillum phage vB_OliS_GJ44]